ncbi:MAG: patatin-like phospholipase family protein [Candidatus Hydrogenedentes bacterium]|nr:patatin-like phospholipase family protein [Candidatus Hydrogenedentota bacterium]
MAYPFKNLIFEGGGVKGIAYVGVLQELEKRKILKQIERVGGTSAGAINAVLLALKYSRKEIQDILWGMQFRNFLDDSWGIVRDSKRVIDEYGWYRGDYFRNWIGNLIAEKTGNPHSTFNDLEKKGFPLLYLVGTNLSTGYAEVFSAEHTPRERVADATRISMSIPLFFAAVRNGRGDVYVDGGVFDNYPVKLFDREKYIQPNVIPTHGRDTAYYAKANGTLPPGSSPYLYNKETLGFRLDTGREIAMFRDGAEPVRRTIDSFFGYSAALVRSVLNVQNNQHLHSDDWQRTIYINTLGVSTTDFDIADAMKKELVQEGLKGARKYFEWYDQNDPNDPPVNYVAG